jgi:hypothetical protein
MKTSFSSLLGTAVLATFVCVGVTSRAAVYSFNVDSSQSTLTLSGAAFGLPVSAQSGHPGSMLDSWSGTIAVDVTGSVLTFLGGGSLTASLNSPASPPFSTSPNPVTGGIDNYGVFGSGLVSGVGLVLGLNGAYRSLVLDITSGTAANGTAPSGVNLAFTGGNLDWGAIISPSTPAGGTSSMVGVSGVDTSSSLVSFDGTTLILPVQLHTLGSNRFEDWTGQIVAVIPEPSSVTLALVGLGLYVARARARRA